MQNSGCKVPEFMLTIKKQSKRVRRQLEKTVTKRDDITVKRPRSFKKKRKFEDVGIADDEKTEKDKSTREDVKNRPRNFVSLPKKRKVIEKTTDKSAKKKSKA